MVELVIMGLVISAFGRGARSTGKSVSLIRLLGGIAYLVVFWLAQVVLGVLSPASPSTSTNPLPFIAIAVLIANGAALGVVIAIGKGLFGSNPLDLNRFFRAFNLLWIFLGFVFLSAVLDAERRALRVELSENSPMTTLHLIMATMILSPAASLYAAKLLAHNAPNAALFAYPVLVANVIVVIAASIYVTVLSEVSHPIAFALVNLYCSTWLAIFAALNIYVLSVRTSAARRQVAPPAQ